MTPRQFQLITGLMSLPPLYRWIAEETIVNGKDSNAIVDDLVARGYFVTRRKADRIIARILTQGANLAEAFAPGAPPDAR